MTGVFAHCAERSSVRCSVSGRVENSAPPPALFHLSMCACAGELSCTFPVGEKHQKESCLHILCSVWLIQKCRNVMIIPQNDSLVTQHDNWPQMNVKNDVSREISEHQHRSKFSQTLWFSLEILACRRQWCWQGRTSQWHGWRGYWVAVWVQQLW